MKKYITKLIALTLCFASLTLSVHAAQISDVHTMVAETSAGFSALHGKPGTLLSRGEEFPAGTSACDWTAMALALSGSREDYDAYLKDLETFVQTRYARNGQLERVKSTTYHRIALTVWALGGNPRNFGTKPDGTAIDLIAEGTYGFAGDSVGAQGLNGWIYALLTLDAGKVIVPENVKFTREDMISAIVNAQEPDGGFGLGTGKSDIDITAMALQALGPYRDQYPEVVEAGLAYLSGKMNENCRYVSYGAENAESAAQVILALCALGIDPETDSRFCRGSQTLLTGMEVFVQPDHTYGHIREDDTGDALATAQVLLALRAVEKLRSGEGWIFDFTDSPSPQKTAPSHMLWWGLAAGVAVLIICAAMAGKRKIYGKNNR